MACWILVPCGRSLDSRYFGDRRDRGHNQACHRPRGVGVPAVTLVPFLIARAEANVDAILASAVKEQSWI